MKRSWLSSRATSAILAPRRFVSHAPATGKPSSTLACAWRPSTSTTRTSSRRSAFLRNAESCTPAGVTVTKLLAVGQVACCGGPTRANSGWREVLGRPQAVGIAELAGVRQQGVVVLGVDAASRTRA